MAKKTFDCVEMKNRIQAELLQERERVGEDVQEERRRDWLMTSDDPLARWWREVSRKKVAGDKPQGD